MSEIIFTDTPFLVAFYNKKDDKHSIARLLVQNFIHHQTSVAFLIIDYIFDETLTTIMRQGGKNLAVDIAQKIYESPSIKIFPIDSEIFNLSYDLFINYRDQRWSFTDCTSFCFLRRYKDTLKVAAFDRHFIAAGFHVIPKNPVLNIKSKQRRRDVIAMPLKSIICKLQNYQFQAECAMVKSRKRN